MALGCLLRDGGGGGGDTRSSNPGCNEFAIYTQTEAVALCLAPHKILVTGKARSSTDITHTPTKHMV